MPKGHHVGPCLGPEASQRFAQHIAAHPISNDSNVNPWCFCCPSVQDVQVEHSEKFITFRDDPEGSQNSKLHQERGWLDVGHPHVGKKTWRWIHLYPLISLFYFKKKPDPETNLRRCTNRLLGFQRFQSETPNSYFVQRD